MLFVDAKFKNITNDITFRDVLIIFVIILFVWLQVQISIKDRKIVKLQQEIVDIRLSQDTLSKRNKEFVEIFDKTMSNMDSLYKLSQISKEDEITHYWDSVYNDLVNDPNSKDILSEWLKEFANKE